VQNAINIIEAITATALKAKENNGDNKTNKDNKGNNQIKHKTSQNNLLQATREKPLFVFSFSVVAPAPLSTVVREY
jgi:hypothetical protein